MGQQYGDRLEKLLRRNRGFVLIDNIADRCGIPGKIMDFHTSLFDATPEKTIVFQTLVKGMPIH